MATNRVATARDKPRRQISLTQEQINKYIKDTPFPFASAHSLFGNRHFCVPLETLQVLLEGEPWPAPQPRSPCSHPSLQGQGRGWAELGLAPAPAVPSTGGPRAPRVPPWRQTHSSAPPGQTRDALGPWALEQGFWEWWPVPAFPSCRRRSWSVSVWFLPALHLCSCTECSSSCMAPQHCSTGSAHSSQGFTWLAMNLLFSFQTPSQGFLQAGQQSPLLSLLSFQTPSQLFIVSILSSWTDETSTSHGKKQAGAK